MFKDKLEEVKSYIREVGQSKSLIGIDIGTSSVKLAQMVFVNGELTLVKSGFAAFEVSTEGENKDTALAALKKALAGIDTKGAKIVGVVNCPKTCTRMMTTPHMPKQELAEAIKWEAKNFISIPLDETIMDFAVIGTVVQHGVKKLNIIVSVSPREIIEHLLSVFSQAGIKLSLVIPLSLAQQNLIAMSKFAQDETIAIIEMGATVTELNIFKNSRLEFSRKLPLAGSDITKSMTWALFTEQGKVELSIEEAENIKKQYGIPSIEQTQLIEGKILPSQILSLIRPMMEQLASEIERSFDFYREESHGGKVDKIILFGGGAKLKGFVKFLGDELGVEVQIGNPLEDLRALSGAADDKEEISHQFNLAVGAALSHAAGLNLLPLEVREETKRFVEKVSLKAVATGVLVLLILFYIGMHVQIVAYEKTLKASKLEQKTLAPQLNELQEMMLINKVVGIKPFWQDVLMEISNIIPPNVYLTHLSMENDNVRLKGEIIQGEQAAEAAFSHFMLTLEEGIFKNVSLVTMKKLTKDSEISAFEIKCALD